MHGVETCSAVMGGQKFCTGDTMLPVVISSANHGYKDFVLNLLINVKQELHNHRFVLYCLDQKLYDDVKQYSHGNIEVRLSNVRCDAEFQEYSPHSKKFIAIDRAKIHVIREALSEFGFIHFVDADVVFFIEPSEEYHGKYKDYDIVYQRDMAPTLGPAYNQWTCVGNMTLRNTPETNRFLNSLQMYEDKYPNENDQECQRILFKDLGVTDIRTCPGVRLTEFPMTEFTMGWVVDHTPWMLTHTMVFHANYVAGREAKIQRLRSVKHWYL